MPIHIAICDDTEEDITLLSDALYSYDPSFEIISYTDGLKLLEDFQDIKNDIDILFLDIYMPGLNGIETAESIRKVRKDLKIIFITSSKEHYPEAYEVFAFNYILKPMDKKRLYNILEQVLDDLKKDSNQKISFTYKSKVYSVEHRHILFIESRDKLILFHKTDGSTLQCYGKLDVIEKELPKQSFIRCHQSFIVNTAGITELGDNYFRIGQVAISISKKYLKQAKEKYYAYLFSQMGRG